MNERRLIRLALILLVTIAVIIMAKYLLTEAMTNLGNAALEKKRAAMMQRTPEAAKPIATEPVPERVPASSVEVTSDVASAVPPSDTPSR
jgi:Sec-independent protein translocase protein TatA